MSINLGTLDGQVQITWFYFPRINLNTRNLIPAVREESLEGGFPETDLIQIPLFDHHKTLLIS